MPPTGNPPNLRELRAFCARFAFSFRCCPFLSPPSSSRTAYRLRLRSSPRTLTPSFLLSSKSLARFGCSLINALTTPHCRYQLFAVSSGKALCIHFSSCRERTPRRSNDRFAPSRVVTRDIRPLVLLLLSEKSHAASLLLACKRARDAPTCYQLFSVSSGKVLCIHFPSCRERTPGVPRRCTWANAVRSVDG